MSVIGRLAGNAGRALRRGAGRVALPRGRFWLRLRLPGPLAEVAGPSLLGREPSLSLFEVLQGLDAAARDERVAGVVVRLAGSPGGVARALALRRGLDGVRAAGKPVLLWSERLGTLELLAASGADEICLPESGGVFLVGLRLESFFLRGLLDRLGVRADVVHVGDFKTAGELFTRETASPTAREQQEALAEDLWTAVVAGIAAGRGLAPERVRALTDAAPFTAPRAVELGLADACCYPDEVEARMLARVPDLGEPDAVPVVDAGVYGALRAGDAGWRPLRRDLPRLALVVASGGIHTGRGRGLRGVPADGYRALFERLRRDEGLSGVLLRVESPGGDAVASDLLWRAVRRLRERVPVVASLGDVAASGGYFLASGADAILAEAGSVTGSIGVVGGKLDVSGLYERLGVRKEAVERGARAGLLAEERPFAPDERRAVRDEMAALYDLFVDRVATGRSLPPDAVRAAGRGRVWSGTRAQELGLVDALGGPFDALGELRRRAGIAAGEPALLEIHPRLPRIVGLGRLLRPWRLGAVGL